MFFLACIGFPGTFSPLPLFGNFCFPLDILSLTNRFPAKIKIRIRKRTERSTRNRQPVMAEITLVSSHAPWEPIPQLIKWSEVDDGSVFDTMAAAGGANEPLHGRLVLGGLDRDLGGAVALAAPVEKIVVAGGVDDDDRDIGRGGDAGDGEREGGGAGRLQRADGNDG